MGIISSPHAGLKWAGWSCPGAPHGAGQAGPHAPVCGRRQVTFPLAPTPLPVASSEMLSRMLPKEPTLRCSLAACTHTSRRHPQEWRPGPPPAAGPRTCLFGPQGLSVLFPGHRCPAALCRAGLFPGLLLPGHPLPHGAQCGAQVGSR